MDAETVIDGQRAVRTVTPDNVTNKNDKIAYAIVDDQLCMVVTNVNGGGGGTSDYTNLENKPQINGVTLVGNKTTADLGITTYSQFADSWTTNDVDTFLSDVYADSSATVGMAYLGELTGTGLPSGLNNVEAVVEILPSAISDKAIHITITSGNLSPYHWELTYWVDGNNDAQSSGWISFQTQPVYNSLTKTLEF